MILQRIARSIKSQDWGSLAIELIVVVIGIFLGLQVDDWNEARKENLEETAYLQRLLADIDEMVAAHDLHVENAQDKISKIIISLESLRICELAAKDEESFEITVLNHQGLPRIPVNRASYDEMVSSGALTRIDDLELKNAISGVFAFAETTQDFVDYFTSDLGRASDIIWRHVSFNIRPDGNPDTNWDESWRGEEYSQTVSYDFESLCQSPEFINAMVEVFDSSKDRLGVGTELAERLLGLRELLLKRPDIRP